MEHNKLTTKSQIINLYLENFQYIYKSHDPNVAPCMKLRQKNFHISINSHKSQPK